MLVSFLITVYIHASQYLNIKMEEMNSSPWLNSLSPSFSFLTLIIYRSHFYWFKKISTLLSIILDTYLTQVMWCKKLSLLIWYFLVAPYFFFFLHLLLSSLCFLFRAFLLFLFFFFTNLFYSASHFFLNLHSRYYCCYYFFSFSGHWAHIKRNW